MPRISGKCILYNNIARAKQAMFCERYYKWDLQANAEYVKGTISSNLASIYGQKYPGWSKLYVVKFALIKGLVA